MMGFLVVADLDALVEEVAKGFPFLTLGARALAYWPEVVDEPTAVTRAFREFSPRAHTVVAYQVALVRVQAKRKALKAAAAWRRRARR